MREMPNCIRQQRIREKAAETRQKTRKKEGKALSAVCVCVLSGGEDLVSLVGRKLGQMSSTYTQT